MRGCIGESVFCRKIKIPTEMTQLVSLVSHISILVGVSFGVTENTGI